MDTGKIRLITLGTALAVVSLSETAARWLVAGAFGDPMGTTLILRAVQAALMLAGVKIFQDTLDDVGLGRRNGWSGFKAGLIWSLVFGGLVAMVFTALIVAGTDPLRFFYLRLNGERFALPLFFITGAVVAPFTEELFFRGLLYGFFRRWGLVAGVFLTTLIFSVLHLMTTSLPVTQMIGSVVFCLAYEKTRSLWTPYIIHGLGNAAIFSLGLMPPGVS